MDCASLDAALPAGTVQQSGQDSYYSCGLDSIYDEFALPTVDRFRHTEYDVHILAVLGL